jgi:hypothetical protein
MYRRDENFGSTNSPGERHGRREEDECQEEAFVGGSQSR